MHKNIQKSQHENGRMQVMAGRYGSILLIVIWVFATLFLMLYMHLSPFELDTHSSKTDRRSSHKYNEDRHSKKSWQCIICITLFERFA